MGSKGSATTTSTSTPNPQAMAAYSNILGRAGQVARTPYEAYGGEGVAGINPQQYQGIQGVNNYANYAQPFFNTAAGYEQQAADPNYVINNTQKYMDPFTNQVVNATEADFANMNAQQRQGVVGNAISQGAFGGNREAIAEAELAHQQASAQDPVIAGLRSKGYQTGLSTALTEQQNLQNAAYGTANLGTGAQQAGESGAAAQIGAGGLEQQTQQALDQYLYGQFQNKQAFPYQQAAWLAGIDTGVGSNMGGTSTTTGPPPSMLGQIAGAGAVAAGLYGASRKPAARGGGIKGYDIGGYIPKISINNENGKDNSNSKDDGGSLFGVGSLLGGLNEMGGIGGIEHQLMGLVPNPGTGPLSGVLGLKGFDSGGEVTPYGGDSYIPSENITHGSGPPKPPQLPSSGGGSGGMGGLGDLVGLGSMIGGGLSSAGYGAATAAGEVAPEFMAYVADALPFLLLNRGGSVHGYDEGGGVSAMPYGGGGISPTPYGGAKSWIPTGMNITKGSGIPKPPAAHVDDTKQQMKDIQTIANELVSNNNQQPKPQLPPPMATSGSQFNPSPAGTAFAPPASAGITPVQIGDDYRQFRRGGGIHGYDEGGTVVRGPQDIGERFSDYMNSLGLPGSLDPSDMEAYPVGAAAVGRGIFGSHPNDRVRRGFDMIQKRTVPHGYADGGSPENRQRNPYDDVDVGSYPGIHDDGSVNAPNIPELHGPGIMANEPMGSVPKADWSKATGLGNYPAGMNPLGAAGIEPEHNEYVESGSPLPRYNPSKDYDHPSLNDEGIHPVPIYNGPNREGFDGVDVASSHTRVRDPMAYTDEPKTVKPSGIFSGIDLSANSKLWPSLMSAGFGMLASRSPFAGVAIGEGGQQGLGTYSGLVEQERKQKLNDAEVERHAKELQQRADFENKKLHLEATKPHHLLTTREGEQIFGIPNPLGGGYINPITGKPINVGGTSYDQENLAPAKPSYVMNANYQEAVDKLPPEIRGPEPPRNEDYLNSINPDDAATVRGLTNYQLNPMSLSTKGGHRERLLGEAMKYDPTYDQSLFPAKQKSINEFYSGGAQSPAGIMTNGNTALLHLRDMSDAIEKFKGEADKSSNPAAWVGGMGIPYISHLGNQIYNNGLAGTGNPASVALNEFQQARQRFSEEVTKFYAGGQGTQAEREHALAILDGAKSLPELRAAIAEDARLMKDKVTQLQNRLMQGMGPLAWRNAFVRDPNGVLLYKNSQEALKTIEGRARGEASSFSEPAPATGERKAGTVYRTPSGDKKWTGTGWVNP